MTPSVYRSDDPPQGGRWLCVECGAPVDPQTDLCLRCLADMEAYAEAHASGLCHRCGAPATCDYDECPTCAACRSALLAAEAEGDRRCERRW